MTHHELRANRSKARGRRLTAARGNRRARAERPARHGDALTNESLSDRADLISRGDAGVAIELSTNADPAHVKVTHVRSARAQAPASATNRFQPCPELAQSNPT